MFLARIILVQIAFTLLFSVAICIYVVLLYTPFLLFHVLFLVLRLLLQLGDQEHQDSVEKAECDFNSLMFGCLLYCTSNIRRWGLCQASQKNIIAAAFFVVVD